MALAFASVTVFQTQFCFPKSVFLSPCACVSVFAQLPSACVSGDVQLVLMCTVCVGHILRMLSRSFVCMLHRYSVCRLPNLCLTCLSVCRTDLLSHTHTQLTHHAEPQPSETLFRVQDILRLLIRLLSPESCVRALSAVLCLSAFVQVCV